MTLEEILENREPGKTLTAHNWKSYCWNDGENTIVNIHHYWTMMIQYVIRNKEPYYPIPVRHIQHVDIGNGSKSDQKGMNRIFVKLGLPWYYARNNGNPRIIELLDPEQVKQLPKNLQDREVRVNIFGYSA